MDRLILVAGLSRSGKSTLADQMASYTHVTHVPLDRYFLPTPADVDFLEFVQSPAAIDWDLLHDHLARLSTDENCYTPVLDPWVTGQRWSGRSHGKERGRYRSRRYQRRRGTQRRDPDDPGKQ